MPNTNVKRSYNAAALITYLEGEAHDDSGVRNVCISSRYLNDQQSYIEQLQAYMRKRNYNSSSGKQKIEAIAIMTSYADDEIDINDPNGDLLCHEMGVQAAERQYPGCPFIVYTQRDGKGHKWHNHTVVFNIHVNDNTAIDYRDYNLYRVRDLNDKILREHGIGLSKSLQKSSTERTTKAEYQKSQLRDEHDEKMNKYAAKALEEINAEKEDKDKISLKDLTDEQKSELLTDEQKEELQELYEKSYSWKQDIKDRVRAAMDAATSEDDFLNKQLSDHGLNCSRHGKKKDKETGKKVEYITYELTDRTHIPDSCKGASRERLAASATATTGLGYDFTLDKLREILQEKQRQQQEKQVIKPKETPKTPEKSTNETIRDRKIEQIPAATKSEEPKQRKKAVKSTVSAAVAARPAPAVRSDSDTIDQYADEVTTQPEYRHRKKNGKLTFDDKINQTRTAAEDIKDMLRAARKSIDDEMERQRQQQRQQILSDMNDIIDEYTDGDDVQR